MGVKQTFFQNAFKVLQGSGLSRVMAPFTQGCGALFMLHRVRPRCVSEFSPNQHLEITPEFLRLSIERIRSNGYEIIALDEAVDLLKSGYGRKRYAVLTFDDGYRDNLEIAYPIMKELDAPFTIYVSSGLVDRVTPLWWMALEKIIAVQNELVLAEPGKGGGIPCRTPQEKEACYLRLIHWLTHEAGEREQRQIIMRLSERYGIDMTAMTDELMMTWNELRQLSAEPLATLGSHTHAHYALARLSPEEARTDIMTCVYRMQAELGRKPKHFAYPYGNEVAVSQRDAQILRDVGFASAVTTSPGVLKSLHSRDTMMLPRVSLNGRFQDPYVVDQYLTGAPFALYKAARWTMRGFGLRSGVSRLFPSTR